MELFGPSFFIQEVGLNHSGMNKTSKNHIAYKLDTLVRSVFQKHHQNQIMSALCCAGVGNSESCLRYLEDTRKVEMYFKI